MCDLVVCSIVSFLGLACAGTIDSDSGDSRVLCIKKGIMVSLPSQLRVNIEKYNMLELLAMGAMI